MRLPDQLDSLVRSCTGLWLVSGVAGFIGSNLLQALLERNQTVRGLDNFSTGHRRNLDQVRQAVSPEQWERFEFRKADIRVQADCLDACRGVRFILHQAALGSVPGSLKDPIGAHATNVTGMLHLLSASHEENADRFVYASSCAVYGDAAKIPINERQSAQPLSPYAGTKLMDEMYASLFARCYGLVSVGLRYFNVFGPRQDPHGAYAAVIPKWMSAMIKGDPIVIYGDGKTSRDFCYVTDIVQANLRAALAPSIPDGHAVFNVGLGQQTSLNQLFDLLKQRLKTRFAHVEQGEPQHLEARAGDVRHSRADLTEATRGLGYKPEYSLSEGLNDSLAWYEANLET